MPCPKSFGNWVSSLSAISSTLGLALNFDQKCERPLLRTGKLSGVAKRRVRLDQSIRRVSCAHVSKATKHLVKCKLELLKPKLERIFRVFLADCDGSSQVGAVSGSIQFRRYIVRWMSLYYIAKSARGGGAMAIAGEF